ncbi:MAG: hypothetical protein E3K37_01230 [Candidatus Kuenenia sp.]|nr:hypothetical protein [Candidatus Kuenenia hertensis]
MKKLFTISLLLLSLAGCSTMITEPEQAKYHSVYDDQGKRTGYIKEQGRNYILYDENWKRTGYIKAE